MSNLIDRQRALSICDSAIDLWEGQIGEGALIAVKDSIAKLPSAEPERKTGKWIFIHPLQSDDPGAYMCSECKMGMWEIIPSVYHYCPNCGSQNRGDEDE